MEKNIQLSIEKSATEIRNYSYKNNLNAKNSGEISCFSMAC